jgi:perosamine synthetase
VKVPAARIVFSADDRARILELVDESLRTGSLTLGPHTAAFEQAFAARHGGGHAMATSSGTSALEIVLRALGVDGGEVIVPANTFFASAAAVIHAGGRVRLADIDAATFALSPATIEAAITDRTVGVMHVHIGGLVSPEIDAVADLCRRRGLWLMEDAAHAHGSSHQGRSAGTFGVAGAFSFYPTKVITSGEGGMILTDDERVRDEALLHRDQGKAGFLGGDHVRLGYAWRMSEVHAAIGSVHLGHLDDAIARRTEIARTYDHALAEIPGVTPLVVPQGGVCNYYKYIALLDHGIDRESFKQHLRDEFEVTASGEVYSKPLHLHPVFSDVPHGPLPVAEDVCARHVCLPVHSDMSAEEAAQVITGVRAVMTRVA